MTDKEILEGNRLIAEFMGYKLITPKMRKNPETWTHSYWQKNYPEKQDVLCKENYLVYNSSWDWLMPCVEKIQMILIKDDHEFCIELYEKLPGEKFTFVSVGENIETENLDPKIAVYEAVVEYIKWFNENKN